MLWGARYSTIAGVDVKFRRKANRLILLVVLKAPESSTSIDPSLHPIDQEAAKAIPVASLMNVTSWELHH